jgi:hypothetical protein
VFGGFYTVRFQLGEAVGRSVMYVRDGKLLGGNSAFAHIGTYEDFGDDISIVVSTVRHNPDPNYRAMAGTDDATLLAHGKADGDLYRFEGRLRELPDVPFQSVMTPIEEQPIPIAGGVGEGGVVDGLYSLRLKMLDGVDGGLTGVMLLSGGRILGGDAFFYYLGTHRRSRPLEEPDPQPGTHAGSATRRCEVAKVNRGKQPPSYRQGHSQGGLLVYPLKPQTRVSAMLPAPLGRASWRCL